MAIILCDATVRDKYEQLLSGMTVLESNLHKNLVEHIASEVSLGTITDLATARTWLRNSFFFQRIQQNPSHYSSILDADENTTWQERADQLVSDAITALHGARMISMETDGDSSTNKISIADLGDIMSRVSVSPLDIIEPRRLITSQCYIRFSTVRIHPVQVAHIPD